MLDWVLAHKETIATYSAYVGSTWVALRWLRKNVWKPLKEWWKVNVTESIEALKELKHNGGHSVKDMSVQNTKALVSIARDIASMKADQDADFQLSKDALFKCNKLGECIAVNDSICKLYGAPNSNKLLGYNWLSFIKHREEVREFWEDGLKSSSVISSDYTVIHGETDEEIECDYVAYVKRNADGEIISIFGIVNRKK